MLDVSALIENIGNRLLDLIMFTKLIIIDSGRHSDFRILIIDLPLNQCIVFDQMLEFT